MNTILKTHQLSKSFKDFKAVDNLSFEVNQGDIFGFLGQNGAGKSTTIRMLLSLIQPEAGSIEIFGMNLHTHRNEILKRVGAVIEKPDLYKYLSAYDNLKLFAKMSGISVSKSLLMDQLELVGLANRYNSKAGTFSQGMKQRLGIAVALVHNPDLIVLDEPTNGLDPQGIADIRNLILKLSHERNKTILVSSHLLSEIELIANRMLIIHNGKKVVEGEVKVLLDPSKTIVKLETGDNQKAFELLSNSNWTKGLSNINNQIQLEIIKSEIPDLIRYLTANETDIYLIQNLHSLEDYFLKLTKTQDHVHASSN
jgi:ABC-type multidrug transport system ATPase subunit